MSLIVTHQAYFWCVVGVLISIILPILMQSIPQPAGGTASVGGFLSRLGRSAKPYIASVVASLLIALLLMAMTGDTFKDWKTALLLGYAWPSTFEKFKKR